MYHDLLGLCIKHETHKEKRCPKDDILGVRY